MTQVYISPIHGERLTAGFQSLFQERHPVFRPDTIVVDGEYQFGANAGGCHFDFEPCRRLPLTWRMNLPGETPDGVNSIHSHVVNISQETSPTQFYPGQPGLGGALHYENYFDKGIMEKKPGTAAAKRNLLGLKNYARLGALL